MGNTGFRLGLGVGAAVLSPFIVYAFLWPADYHARAIVKVHPASASAKLPQDFVARLRGAIDDSRADLITLEAGKDNLFAIDVTASDPTRAQWLANLLATRAAARTPSLIDPDTARRATLESERERSAAELARFLQSHPEIESLGTQAAPDPKRDLATARAFAKLEEERARIRAELALPPPPPAADNPYDGAKRTDPALLNRRLKEIESRFAQLNRERKAAPAVLPNELRSELDRLLDNVDRARAAAERAASARATVSGMANVATLARPNRARVLSLGAMCALLAVLLTALARRRSAAAFDEDASPGVPSEPPGALLPAASPANESKGRPISSWPPPVLDRSQQPLSSVAPAASPPERPTSSRPPPGEAVGRRPSSFPPAAYPSSSFPPSAAGPAENAALNPPPGPDPIRPSSSRPPLARLPSDPPTGLRSLVMAHRVQSGWSADPSLQPEIRGEWCDRLLPLVADRGLVLAISSPSSATADKGRVASELALALSHRQNARILILEADFHSPTLHQWLRVDMPPFAGYSEQLRGRVDRAENPHWYVVHCNEFLHVLVEGATPVPELILSRHFEESLLEFREYYDVIVLDAPSIESAVECRAVSDVSDRIALVGSSTPLDEERLPQLFPHREIERIG